MKTIAMISEEEAKQASDLIEKRNALRNLAELIQNDSSRQKLYADCHAEMKQVEEEYINWWNKIIDIYQLAAYQPEYLYVDANEKTIVYEATGDEEAER